MTTPHALTQLTSTARWLSLTTAFGSVVTGGTLFAFSTFVLPALRRLPTADAITAMQQINIEAPRSLLLVPLVGSALGGAALLVYALTHPDTPDRALLIGGGVLATLTLVITGGYHQPHNLALGTLDPHATGAATAWADYTRGWLLWNHVRTATALSAGIALVACVLRRTS